MSSWRDVKKLRERYNLLSEWYGKNYAATEMAAHSHTPQPHALTDILPEVVSEMNAPEARKLLQLDRVWNKVIGESFARFVKPGHFKGDELFVEVRHSALVAELQPITEELRTRINAELGENFCSAIRIIASGSRPRPR